MNKVRFHQDPKTNVITASLECADDTNARLAWFTLTFEPMEDSNDEMKRRVDIANVMELFKYLQWWLNIQGINTNADDLIYAHQQLESLATKVWEHKQMVTLADGTLMSQKKDE